jgi:hypothetical protein
MVRPLLKPGPTGRDSNSPDLHSAYGTVANVWNVTPKTPFPSDLRVSDVAAIPAGPRITATGTPHIHDHLNRSPRFYQSRSTTSHRGIHPQVLYYRGDGCKVSVTDYPFHKD